MNYTQSDYPTRIKIVCNSKNPEIFIFQENNYYMLEFIFSRITNKVTITQQIMQASQQNLFQFTKYFRLCHQINKKVTLHPPNNFIQKDLINLFLQFKSCDEKLKTNPNILYNFIYPQKSGQILEDLMFFTLKRYYSEYLKFIKDKEQLYTNKNPFVDSLLGKKNLEKELMNIINSEKSCTLLLFYLEICSPIKFLTSYYNNTNKPKYIIFNQILYTIELSFQKYFKERDEKYIQKVVATLTQITTLACLENIRHFIIHIFNWWVMNLIEKNYIKQKEIDFFTKAMLNIMKKTYFDENVIINDSVLDFPLGIPSKTFNGRIFEFVVFISDKFSSFSFNSVINKTTTTYSNKNCSFLCLRLIIYFLENGIIFEKALHCIDQSSESISNDNNMYKWSFLAIGIYIIKATQNPVYRILKLFSKTSSFDYFEDFVIYITFIMRNTLHAKKYAQSIVKIIDNVNVKVILMLLYGAKFENLRCSTDSFSHPLKLMAWKKATNINNNINVNKNTKKMYFDLEKHYMSLF